jgi:hypothetical protein
MSVPCKFERSILSYDEHEIILRSHHPEIYDAALDDLKALRQRLREMRDKERTPGARETPCGARKRGAERRKLSRHSRASLAAQAGVRRRVETREQGDRSHTQARGANRAYRGGPPRSRHAPCGSVSCASPERRHSERRHAGTAQPTAADTSSSGKDRKRVTSNKKCASR